MQLKLKKCLDFLRLILLRAIQNNLNFDYVLHI